MLILFILTSFISFLSDNSGAEGYFTSAPDSNMVYHVQIDYTKIPSHTIFLDDEIYFINPTLVNVIDSLLIITDQSERDIFSFINLNTMERIGTYGYTGRGPGEITGFAFTTNVFKPNNSFLHYLNWGGKTLERINLSQLLSTFEYTSEHIINLPPALMLAQRVIPLNDSVNLGGFGIREGLLFFLHTNDGSIQYLPFIPKLDNESTFRNIGMIYRGHITVNYSKRKFAVALENFNQIQIYNFDGEILSISQPLDYVPIYSESQNSENYIFYNGIATSEDKIFASYFGIPRSETRDLVMSSDGEIIDTKNRTPEERPTSKMHVYDWYGNLLQKFQLDSRLRAIAVDVSGKYLYGLDIYNFENPIKRVKLPD